MTAYIWLGFIGMLLAAGAAAYFYGRKSGIEAAEGRLAKDEAKASEAANEAQINAPRTPQSIDDRLRKGGGL